MTLRKLIFAGLVAGLAVPAVAQAARAGLTRYDLEHGNVFLLSQRTAANTTETAKRPQHKNTRTAKNEHARHDDAMDKGNVRVTKG